MLRLNGISVNGAFLRGDSRYRTVGSRDIRIGWKALSDTDGDRQTHYEVQIGAGTETFCVSAGDGKQQNCLLRVPDLPEGTRLTVCVKVESEAGDRSELTDYFYYADPDWTFPWIGMKDRTARRAIYFRKRFYVSGEIDDACLVSCGLGYSIPYLNGNRLNDARMDPAFSDYTKTCYYVADAELGTRLKPGENELAVTVGDGWRVFDSVGLLAAGVQIPRFSGETGLSACLFLRYRDGHTERISTGEGWEVAYGPVTSCSIYDGETYDANMSGHDWRPASILTGPEGNMRLMDIPPIRMKETYTPCSVIRRGDRYILDFGQNLAGVLRVRLPADLRQGQMIRVTFSEELDEDGELYTAPLRDARCTDTYIASGDSRDLTLWQPEFTYHGFRYACVSGFPTIPDRSDFTAVALRTDVEEIGSFTSGSAILNAIQHNCLMTEKANIHSILTDCPQRDERLGWINDATVRVESAPYLFDFGRMLRKFARDAAGTQGEDGSITDTSPYVAGGRPADPVCSSYLISVMQGYLRTEDPADLTERYEGLKRWEDCILRNSTDMIVDYSYYGDWASPEFVCRGPEDAYSSVTPGILLSTGFSYKNCTILAAVAKRLGRTEDRLHYEELAAQIRDAYLAKWLDEETGRVAEGSQACQAFTLWLGILPDSMRERVARYLHEDLQMNGYRITTGSICTRYLLEALSENGYVNDAYRILCSESYPGFGYMIQNEATTVWERLELKKNPSMNSHNHPMYASCNRWFFACLLGIVPSEDGWSCFRVTPKLPDGLLSASGTIETPYGTVAVRWTVRYGMRSLYLTVPFGAEAEVEFEGVKAVYTSGSHVICVPDENPSRNAE